MAILMLPVKVFERVPARLNVALMIFSCCGVAYMLRVNMSVNILAMVPTLPDRHNSTSTSECGEAAVAGNSSIAHVDISDVRQAPRPPSALDATFEWGAGAQSLVLGSYFWGYLVTSLLGGMAAERWGARRLVGVATAAASVLTALCVPAAHAHYILLVTVRFCIGLTGGFIYPALHALVAQWAPPAEKGKFISALTGGTLGTVITWSLTGPLIEALGWQWAFYIPAAVALVWCALWLHLVADTPADHPRISDEESKYIRDALGDKVKKTKNFPPFMSIATSLPFLAMVVLHYGNMWGLYFIMTVGPKFVSSVLGFELSTAGAVSALPYLARMICAMLFGFIGDCIVEKRAMSTTAIRKWFCLFSHVLPGVMLVTLLYAGCSTTLSVTLISLSMAWNGAATLTNLQNHQDLAPNFAGTLYGIANFVGGTAGFITPLVTAHYTQHGNSFADWRPVFFIGASVYIVTALFFALFGTGQTQPWNDVDAAAATAAAEAAAPEATDDKPTKTNDVAIDVPKNLP